MEINYWSEWIPSSTPKRPNYRLNDDPECVICGGHYKTSELDMGRCKFCLPHVHENNVNRYMRRGKHNPYD